jgi:hypothetical protein
MSRVAVDDPCLDGVGKDAAEKTNRARGRSSAASDDGLAAQLLGLDRNPRLSAMMSLRTLLMSVLVRSLTRRVPMRNYVTFDTASIGDDR